MRISRTCRILSLTLVAFACKTSQTSKVKNDLDKKSWPVGTAYDQKLDQYVGSDCLDLSALTANDFDLIPPKWGEAKITADVSAEEFLKDLGGSVKGSYSAEGFKLSGAFEMAKKNEGSDVSTAIVASVAARNGSYRLKPDSQSKIKLNELGIKLADAAINAEFSQETMDAFQKACGTHILSGFSLSASLVASLKYTFKNSSDKSRFTGNVALEMEGIKADGSTNSNVTSSKVDSTLKFEAVQNGGNALLIGSLLDEKIIDCTANNQAPCRAAMKNIFAKMQSFGNQFKNATAEAGNPEDFKTNADGTTLFAPSSGNLAANRFVYSDPEYMSYSKIYPKLTGVFVTPETAAALKLSRETMADQFATDVADRERVRTLLKSGYVPDIQTRSQLTSLQQTFDARLRKLSDLMKDCYNISAKEKECRTAAETFRDVLNASYKVDYSLLTVVPKGFKDFCALMISWNNNFYGNSDIPSNPAAAELDMGANTIAAMETILNETVTAGKIKSRIPKAATFTAYTKDAAVWSPRHPDFQCPLLNNIFSNITEEIKLTGLNLKDVSPVRSYTDTGSLDISGNRIEAGMESIAALNYVETVNASNSRIKFIKGFANSNVIELNLAGNSITSDQLPYLSGMISLKTLDLSNNKLESVIEMPALPSLAKLTLSGNSLILPSDVAGLMEKINKTSRAPEVLVRWSGVGELCTSTPLGANFAVGKVKLTCL